MEMHYGTSGNPPNFFKSIYGKNTLNAPEWLNSIGLNAYERLMTYGARTKEEVAVELGKKAKKFDVSLSVHAPYYIVFTSEKEKVVENSINEMLKTARLAKLMGARKVVFHPGFGKNADKVISCLKKAEKDKPKDVVILPETMGKKSQLGSLDEVLRICTETECRPCIDFAHLHARENGSLEKKEAIRQVLIEIEKSLGSKQLKQLHCHYYPVDFNDKGEKKHRAVMDENVFPRFQPFGELIKEFCMNPTLISESRDSQDTGALEMKATMEKLLA